jgi:hypothetical protein
VNRLYKSQIVDARRRKTNNNSNSDLIPGLRKLPFLDANQSPKNNCQANAAR